MGKRPYPYLTSFTKINPKWITDLNIIAKTIKLLEEKYRTYSWTSVTEDFLNIKSISHEEKIEKADHQNLKLCPLKDSCKDKRQTGRKYLQHVCEKGTVYRIY